MGFPDLHISPTGLYYLFGISAHYLTRDMGMSFCPSSSPPVVTVMHIIVVPNFYRG
ncbi:hypothetical protein D3C80_1902950 [compost metagenome]